MLRILKQIILIQDQLIQKLKRMCERKPWTEKEDEILKELKQSRRIAKWSQIASIMKQEFQIFGRNGKQCRERYHNHLDSGISKHKWTCQQEARLLELHNQWGNRWAAISRQLKGRTDNCVKNHFYSYFRKCIKIVNSLINSHCKKRIRPLKLGIINKIVLIIESYHKDPSNFDRELYDQAKSIKIEITSFTEIPAVIDDIDIRNLQELTKKISVFNKTNRTKLMKKKKLKIESDQSEQLKLKNNQSYNYYDDQIVKNIQQEQIVKEECVQTEDKIKVEAPDGNKENYCRQFEVKKQNQIYQAVDQTPVKNMGKEEKQRQSSYCIINSVDYLDVKNYSNYDIKQFISIDDEREWKSYFQ